MPLSLPLLDNRDYQRILNDALARVGVHNPEWTNLQPADPGVTILQVFAFMVESLQFRCNQIPERNRRKFLQLLGLPMRPPQASRGLVTFSNPKGPLAAVPLPPDTGLKAGKVDFRTRDGVETLPVEARAFFKRPLSPDEEAKARERYAKLSESFREDDTRFLFYNTEELEAPKPGHPLPVHDISSALDGSLWLALLARKPALVEETRSALSQRVLSLGLVPAGVVAERVLDPGGRAENEAVQRLQFQMPDMQAAIPGLEQGGLGFPQAVYRSLAPKLLQGGDGEAWVVQMQLPKGELIDTWTLDPLEEGVGTFPPSLAETDVQDRLVTWIRVYLPAQEAAPASQGTGASNQGTASSSQASRASQANQADGGTVTVSALAAASTGPADKARRLLDADPCGCGRGREGDGGAGASGEGRRDSFKLSWVGINAARIRQGSHVAREVLGRGTGEPDQALALANRPVLPDTLQVWVDGVEWRRVDDLAAAPPEVPASGEATDEPGALSGGGSGSLSGDPSDGATPESRVFALDAEAGLVRFGDGSAGARPPAGASVQAAYDHGGGREGLVPAGGVDKGASLPPGIKPSNPVPTWGGSDGETVDQAERRISRYLQNRDRLVNATDFMEIAWRTPGVDLGRVEVLPMFRRDLPGVTLPGTVTVMVIPAGDPINPENPEPDRFFLGAVARHLNPRRLVTTELRVAAPEYVDVQVSAGVETLPGRDPAAVQEDVRLALKAFLSPLKGGFEEGGWPLGKAVESLELATVAARVSGVAKVRAVRLSRPGGGELARVELEGLELPRLQGLAVGEDPPEIEATTPPVRELPIPVPPEEC